jgi:hypothetical protein
VLCAGGGRHALRSERPPLPAATDGSLAGRHGDTESLKAFQKQGLSQHADQTVPQQGGGAACKGRTVPRALE